VCEMSLVNPASISLGGMGDEEEVLDDGSVPAVGASVVIEQEVTVEQPTQHDVINSQEAAAEVLVEEQELRNGARQKSSPRLVSVGRILPKPRQTYEAQGAFVRRIPVEKITAEMYVDFVTEMTGGEVHTNDAEYRETLDALIDGDDFSVACGVEDELLGHLDYVIIHLPSKRFVLMPDQRERVIEAAVERFKNELHPIGSCLHLIQRNYIGFPPIIKLRNALLECLNRVVPPAPLESDLSNAVKDGRECFTSAPIPHEAIDMKPSPSRRSNVRSMKPSQAITPDTPVPDNQYDTLAQILAGKMNIEDVKDWMVREAIKARLTGELEAEYWTEPGEFLPPGWRIRVRESGKILPRKGEIDEIWRRCCEAMSQTHNQKEILAYLEERYAGVATKSRLRLINKDVLIKGTRVQFPSKPRCLGSKPMQYVQIDMVEMESSEYGDRCYNMALLVTDLYSQYVFGRALSDALDPSLLVRHLMDIFGAFAPPEAYRSFTNNVVIEHVMTDIERLFKVHIKNVGNGVMNFFNLRTSMYKRAEEELGSRERWVEALPFAVIEYNQKPLKGFGDVRISPFEIMFGRRPWKEMAVPPWMNNGGYGKASDDDDEFSSEPKRAVESISGESDMGFDKGVISPATKKTRRPDPGATLANIYLGEMSENRGKISFVMGKYPVKYDEQGRVVDPGTGFMYEIGDHVYMRNITHRDFFHKSKKRSNVPRYFRATIIDIDHENPDFMYRVLFWDDVPNIDSVPADQWPDQGEECLCAWVSPFDISPSTPDLSRRRNIVKRREMEYQCKCGYDFCELVFSEKCPFKLSQACCQRLKMDCPYHKPPDPVPSKVLKVESPVKPREPKRKVPTPTPVGMPAQSSASSSKTAPRVHVKSRWIYQGGRLVEIPATSAPATQAAPAPPSMLALKTRAPLLTTGRAPRLLNRSSPTASKQPRLELDEQAGSSNASLNEEATDSSGDIDIADLGPVAEYGVARLIPYEKHPPKKFARIKTNSPPMKAVQASTQVHYYMQPSSTRLIQSPAVMAKRSPSNTSRVMRTVVSRVVPRGPSSQQTASYVSKPISNVIKREGAAESGKRISAPPKRLSPDPQGSR
uniref:Integrase catalytic domain-containing protein n=5 Tax=Parascaris univalens TaxID=6257 RepID=A0A914ZKT3_PARUN